MWVENKLFTVHFIFWFYYSKCVVYSDSRQKHMQDATQVMVVEAEYY